MSTNSDEKTRVLVALGGNLDLNADSPLKTIQNAFENLHQSDFVLYRQSRYFQTPCFPVGMGPDYINAAAIFLANSNLSPADVLARFHQVEAQFGRARLARWGGRTLDIDLLAMGDSVLPDRATYALWRDLPADQQSQKAPDRLILPHPRLQDRAFVLIPLLDVAPDWRHPVSGLDVRQMCAALPDADRAAVVAVAQT